MLWKELLGSPSKDKLSISSEGRVSQKASKAFLAFLTFSQSIINLSLKKFFKETSSSRVVKIQQSLLKQIFLLYALNLWNFTYVWKTFPLISTGGFWKSRSLSYLDSNTASGKSFQVWTSCCLRQDTAWDSVLSFLQSQKSEPTFQEVIMACLLQIGAIAPWSVFFNSMIFVSCQINVHALLELTLPTTLSSK